MYIAISFLMAVIPSVLLVCYYYRQDSIKPEPKGLIIKIFLLGIASVVPVIFLEFLASLFNQLFTWSPVLFYLVRAFVVAGLCEEFIKLCVVKRFAYNHVYFDEVMDGIVYAVVASLGFACMENIMYVMGSNIQVAVIRAVTAVPMHSFCSGLMGYYIGKAKFAGSKKQERAFFYKGLGIAVFLHGLYDFCLFISPVWGFAFSLLIFPIIVVAFLKLRGKIKMAIKEDGDAGRTL
ncbi:MAG: PrsW family intramembrane metalloprotease [Planctomycetota bacterium]|jgi:RsiW-degrading membrane proteinase PrsW (M82 family)